MKIKKLYLKNFIGIYAGLGLKEITIDFNNSENNMIMIIGNNGTGKSLILSQLNPYRTSNDIRKNQIIEGEKGLKEITFDRNGVIYDIKHHYGKNSSQNKSFIKKDGKELNENGGIKLFNQIVEEELGVSQEYFTVGRLGDNVNNFIDYTTGDRKTYINKFVPNIDKYLEAFKTVSDKKRVIDKDLKSLNLDLERYKQFEDIKKDKNNLENNIDNIRNTISNLESKKTSSETKINSIMDDKYKDIHPNDKIQNINNEIQDLRQKLKSQENLINENEKLRDYSLEDAKEKEKVIENAFNQSKSDLTIKKNDLNNINEKIEDINNRVSKVNSRMNAIKFNEEYDASSDIESILKQYDEEINELENLIQDNLKEFNNNYNIEFEFNKINSETLDNYNSKPFLSELKQFIDFFNENELQYNKITNNEDIINEINSNSNMIENLTKELSEYNQNLNQIKGKSDLLKILDQKDHEHFNECVFVPLVADFKTNEFDSITSIEDNINNTNNKINELKEINLKLSKNQELNNKYNNLKKLYDNINEYVSFDLLNEEIVSYLKNNSITNLENKLNKFSKLNESLNKYNLQKEKAIQDKDKKERNLKEDKNNEELLKQYQSDKEELETELNKVKENHTNLKEEALALQSRKNKAEKNLNTIKEFINFSEESENIKNNINELENSFNEIQSDLNKMAEYHDEMTSFINQINDNKQVLESQENELNSVNEKYYTVSSILSKIDDIEKVLWKYSLVAESLNPKKDSIPLIFITNYLKDIAVSTNELLSVAYNDQFKIDFDLTDKDFFVNVFKGNGTELQDIKEASQGETALTNISLSLSLLNKVSDTYNILYLDEMDATLDSNNRRRFVDVIDKQIEIMDLEQVFLISHNNEFYSSNIDLILLNGYEDKIDINDKNIMEGKNVLFKVN